MSDEIRRWSDELARDPASMVFLQLGEALRRQGQLDLAQKVAIRGLERRPHNADAHDLLARIYVDRGDLERAFDEWDMVLRLMPEHAGALKGMGFVYFRQGQLDLAERFLGEAALADDGDPSIAAAIELVKRRTAEQGDAEAPADRDGGAAVGSAASGTVGASSGASSGAGAPPQQHDGAAGDDGHHRSHAPRTASGSPTAAAAAFAEVLGDGQQAALLLDASGLVLAGSYEAEGRDVAQEIGAELSGVSDEARRAMRHLGLGEWSSIVLETATATVALAPAPGDALVVVAAERATPLGFVRRLLDRVAERARQWLEGAA